MGECSNAREVMLAVQEAVERLESQLSSELDEDAENEADNTAVSPPEQLIRLVLLYAASIPRLKERGKKTPAETVNSLLYGLESAVGLASSYSTKSSGRDLISAVSQFISKSVAWVAAMTNTAHDQQHYVTLERSLRNLLDRTITSNARWIQSSIAQRTFETLMPRLVFRSAVKDGWEEASAALHAVADDEDSPPLSALILLAYDQESPLSQAQLTHLFPAILTSLRSNIGLDETLAVLLRTLVPSPRDTAAHSSNNLSPELLIPLIDMLDPLASAHSDPPTRHLCFRLLGLAINQLPPPARLDALRTLTSEDAAFPQMRVAGIGLVKDAVLGALAGQDESVFASPLLLQTFAPILLQPSPRDLFASAISAEEFIESESREPARLAEALSFYYVLLQRDTRNRTRVRDVDVLANVEANLLAPLRTALERWRTEMEGAPDTAAMTLASLEMGLERVASAVASFS
ncbi:hypothetical protein PLICRDRAFT_354784 [Plicaturopsis crispa FD-325 SS-3]|uniref:Uncharacterized protein n=1 Tax=Plicaturopsis crispa FD-325 SS-3 TaxID=944288 RepID=A0A0C9SXU6_PLICR|nr:hypothetical protein PLICRDRAFT_354784 [Plicaturopsis crispa FD-325 SS-3]